MFFLFFTPRMYDFYGPVVPDIKTILFLFYSIDLLLQSHVQQCGFGFVRCGNQCGTFVYRADLKHHMDYECSRRTTKCKFCNNDISHDQDEVIVTDTHACMHACAYIYHYEHSHALTHAHTHTRKVFCYACMARSQN